MNRPKRLEDIRLECNRSLFLGLDSFEGHFAVYSQGAHYGRHKDVFQTQDTRVLSLIIYLNSDWKPGMGGELVIHVEPAFVVEPKAGTLVLFLSHEFEHEVLKTECERNSLCGWFRKSNLPK